MIRGATLIAASSLLIAGTAGAASAANRMVRVENQTEHRLVRLYAAGHVYSGGHYVDWLGRNVVDPNEYLDVNFDDGSGDCVMAVVGVFSDGDEVTNEHFNVCAESRLVFTGN
jgi:hypothetical protein